MPPVLGRRAALAGATLAAATLAAPALRAAAPTPIRIAVLSDQSGVYSEAAGPGSVLATRMAVADFLATKPGFEVEVIAGDHQNKPDIGATLARAWYDRDGVDAISDVPGSAVALAVATLTTAKDKVALLGGAGAMDFTGRACSPNVVQTVYDTYSLVAGTVRPVVAQGGTSWFFITADYVFGRSLEEQGRHFVEQAGGTVAGSVRYPFPGTSDFSSPLLRAQSSGAKVVALMMSGDDMTNCLKQAAEFGITRGGQRLAAGIMLITNIHAAGLATTEGVLFTSPFYWDRDAGTRAFAARFAAGERGNMPSFLHAAAYSGALQYLKAVSVIGPARAKESGRAVVAQMKAMPFDDALFGAGSIRADGRGLHDMYLMQVKTPAEQRYPWDYCRILQTLTPDQVVRPLSPECRMVHA